MPGLFTQDLQRAYSLQTGSTIQRSIRCYRSPGLHAVAVFRFGHWLLGQSLPVKLLLKPLFVLLSHRIRAKWGISIDSEAAIGGGLHIFHYGGIFIGGEVVIGRNASISQDVTIGLAGDGNRRGAPVIGDNVYIAPGANVSGKIRIGDNVKIGANTVVNRNIPDNTLVQLPKMQAVTFPSFGDQASAPPEEDP